MFNRFSLKKYLLRRINTYDRIELSNRNIYILPTKEGLFFSLILLLMLLTAINFSNSLIFLVTFFLASLAVISMLFAQKNLLALGFQTALAKPVFCGENILIPFIISTVNQHKTYPSSLTIRCEEFSQTIDLLKQNDNFSIVVKTNQRGYIKLPPITVSSTFPYGLFYAWSLIKLTNQSIVYPLAIETNQAIQLDFVNGQSGENDQANGMEDFTGLDKFTPGQSLKKVHWKAYAKQQGMYIKNYSGGATSNNYWFDLESFDSKISLEKRLSYLSFLITKAEQNGHSYGLKIANKKIAINSGKTHKHICLKALALYKPLNEQTKGTII